MDPRPGAAAEPGAAGGTGSLFHDLLGEDWHCLAAPVRRMHDGAACIQAHGLAEVHGAPGPLARVLRRVLGLPRPGPAQPIGLTITRAGQHESWTRRFATRHMHSRLDRAGSTLLRERLGPVTLRFALQRQGETIDWQLRQVHVLGLPLPRRLHGRVLARSGACDGRYEFRIDARVPLIGQLVAYHGWLEIADAA
ncbi:DUF4166 domain-containing protein [Dyella sp.]|jgi:hypothetical protein|uniref:DUF4166 domain-containing protein n=1 Tax=Dyella sp. TaxID=1869338 RepID=UPI002D78FD3F|nr:DUF4166 domain-containing protein [Dyella sp.]HET6431996.1 DUF4166 domain-containing protein [Dyella sp.]